MRRTYDITNVFKDPYRDFKDKSPHYDNEIIYINDNVFGIKNNKYILRHRLDRMILPLDTNTHGIFVIGGNYMGSGMMKKTGIIEINTVLISHIQDLRDEDTHLVNYKDKNHLIKVVSEKQRYALSIYETVSIYEVKDIFPI